MKIDVDFKDISASLDSFLKLPQNVKSLIWNCLTDTEEGVVTRIWVATGGIERCLECQSPIEQLFYVAYSLAADEKDPLIGAVFFLKPQKRIKVDGRTYYADFCIDFIPDSCFKGNEYHLIIECDGHDFHERTKEQVAKGNNRDMDLKRAGYDVIHFSGSQIFKDPFQCAEDVLELLSVKACKLRE
jgi:very-short-patch-repair endonuclease